MKRLFLFFLTLFFIGCRSSRLLQSVPSSPPDYSLIYVIHGDANYLYHNAEGQGLQADEQVLQQAKSVARNAKHGAVYIFHQKPERKVLWLFPRKDRQFYYYRNGKLVAHKKYSPRSDSQSFVAESALYHKYAKQNTAAGKKIWLYFGHEVPVRSHNVYHYSRPDVPFDTQIFARGVRSFITQGQSPFSLIVLSTCNNGTPSMVQALTPYTRYLLASPQNLHLSDIDTGQLASLLEQPHTTSEIADSMAVHTYKRLTSFLQTAVTLSIYDTRATASYLPPVEQQYEKYLHTKSANTLLIDNKDCHRLPFFQVPAGEPGVQKWYKAPRFGQKEKATTEYSGWGCK